MASVGRNMAYYRKKRNMSIEAMADAMCMPVALIRDLETGKVKPTEETLEGMAEILDVSPTTLLYGETRGERRGKILRTVLNLLVLCVLAFVVWHVQGNMKGSSSDTVQLALRAIVLCVFPAIAVLLGKNLMKLIESVTRAMESDDDPGHTQDRGLYAFLILILVLLAIVILPYLLMQCVTTLPGMGSLPGELRQAAWTITQNHAWNSVIVGAQQFFSHFPVVYLVFAVFGSGLWAARPRKREKLKKHGAYSE